jgi:hypothetical protein
MGLRGQDAPRHSGAREARTRNPGATRGVGCSGFRARGLTAAPRNDRGEMPKPLHYFTRPNKSLMDAGSNLSTYSSDQSISRSETERATTTVIGAGKFVALICRVS